MKTIDELWDTTNLIIKEVSQDGLSGVIFKNGKPYASVIASDGGGWEHVSIAPFNRRIVPDWEDMCRLKDMFFHDDECCVQYHPPKSEYVNMMQNCLHIWKPLNESLPMPPAFMVGLKPGQTVMDFLSEVKRDG